MILFMEVKQLMSDEELLEKAENILRGYNDFTDKVLNESISKKERRSAAIQIKKIHIAFNVLSIDEITIIKDRYILNMSWSAICKAMRKSRGNTTNTKNICNKALKRLAIVLLPYDVTLLDENSTLKDGIWF